MKNSSPFQKRYDPVFLLFLVCGVMLGGCETDFGHDLPYPTIRKVNFEAGKSGRNFQTRPPNPSGGGNPWIPPARLEEKGRWKGIVVHHSALDSGSPQSIDRLHKNRGFDGLGYHFVITNGLGGPNGKVNVGYRWHRQEKGAHCRVDGNDSNYWNKHTIGICLVGNFENTRPTQLQYESLAKLVRFLQNRYRIPTGKIKGHGDIKATKCPGKNFSFWEFKRRL
jgi:hypothetical protein